MAPKSHDKQNESVTETTVEVDILNSSPLIISVPGELDPQDPAFIQYVTQEALDKYKDMVRWENMDRCLSCLLHCRNFLKALEKYLGSGKSVILPDANFLNHDFNTSTFFLQVWRWIRSVSFYKLPALSVIETRQ